jgi:hypothetical protein
MAGNLKVLGVLAERYEQTRAGRTGQAARDLTVDYEELLRIAGCATGDDRVCAERDLTDAESKNLLKVERHRRGGIPLRVRFSAVNESLLFEILRRTPPAERRKQLAESFQDAAATPVPEEFRRGWHSFCHALSEAALVGGSILPFSRENFAENRELLALVPKLLAWRGESLFRFASSVLCGNSKRLEQLRSRIEVCLERITAGKMARLADLGIVENERSLLVHGPLSLVFDHGNVDLSLLTAPIRIDRRDILRADFFASATRCLTIENASMLHELAKLAPGIILASSGSEGGFAHSTIISFLHKVPTQIECWHFGDSDPKGFEILHNLRARVQIPIRSLHMGFRADPQSPLLTRDDINTIERLLTLPLFSEAEKHQLRIMRDSGRKGRFEQESLGSPSLAWPFYATCPS